MSSSGGKITISGSIPAGENIIGYTYVKPKNITLDSQGSTVITASGTGAVFSTIDVTEVIVDIDLTAISGTGAAITFELIRFGADGNEYPFWQSQTVDTIGMISTSVGAGMATPHGLNQTVFLKWTLAGTTPSTTFSYSVLGR